MRISDWRSDVCSSDLPKFDHWWAFPACVFNDTFAGNERALFEEVRNDPSIKKIVLTRKKRIDIDGKNVVVVPLNSPDRKSVVWGKSVSVRVDLGGRRIIKQKR